MTAIQKWVLRVLKPRTRFACFLWFLPLVLCAILLIGSLLFLWEYLGFGKLKGSVATTVLFWSVVFAVWKIFFPSADELKKFWLTHDADTRTQRIAELEKLASRGDARAACDLGDMCIAEDATSSNLQRALYWFDLASSKLPDAAGKAVRTRQTLADAAIKKQRLELEAKIPESLDATCPNCSELLDITSVKCLKCGAIFSTPGTDWRPIPHGRKSAAVAASNSGAATFSSGQSLSAPDLKPNHNDRSATDGLKRFARIAVWSAHFCLVASILTIGLGYLDSGFARLIVVAPFLYLAWATLAIFVAIKNRGKRK
jgi:hypothetical protein